MIQLNIREACKKQKDDISIAMQYIHSRQPKPQMLHVQTQSQQLLLRRWTHEGLKYARSV